MYSREKLNEIKSKIDNYFDWYKQYLPELKQTGSNRAFSPCCFHSETKPSLCIDINHGMWRCFGSCNTGGDIFSFYQKLYNISFSEAVQVIAEQVGVTLELDPEVQKELEYKKSLCNINKIMCDKYQLSLKGNTNAWNYLTQIRNFSPKIIEHFKLGCGINKLPEKESLKQLGLLKFNEKNNEYYPTFRTDRITIPRIDEHGNIVSFTGRLCVEKDTCKYLHTTDTVVYEKSKHVFGLYQARKYIKHFNSVVCVEGELDCIRCHQKGIVNAVSISGLNMSDYQVNLLKKYTNVFYICVEDDAILRPNDKGETSLDKLYNTIKSNIPYAKVYIVDLRLSNGEKCDPDMYLQTHSKEEFKQLLQSSKIYNEFIISEKLKDINPKNIEEKTACINMVIPFLYSINDFLTRKQYIELVANKLCVPENDIYRKVKYYTEKQDKINTDSITYDSRPVFAQKVLLSTCFAPNFNPLRSVFLVNFNALELMEPFYKSIFLDYIAPYIKKYVNEPKVDFTDLFTELSCNNDINDIVKKTIMDIYMKIDMFEDLEECDLEELINEQIETLQEYVIVNSEI